MRNIIIALLNCCLPILLISQSTDRSVVGSSGTHFSSDKGQIEWTLGEVMTETLLASPWVLTQGFHQGKDTACLIPPAYITFTILPATGNGTTSPPPGENEFLFGQTVILSATPSPGWTFCEWTGDIGTIANPSSANTTITLDCRYTVQAVFAKVEPVTGVFPDPLAGFISGDIVFTFDFQSMSGSLNEIELDIYLGPYAGEGNRVYSKHLGFNFPANNIGLEVWIESVDGIFASNTRSNLVIIFGQGDTQSGEWYVRIAEALGFIPEQSNAAHVKTRLFFDDVGNSQGIWTMVLDTEIIDEPQMEFLVSVTDDLCGKWGENNFTLPGTQAFLYTINNDQVELIVNQPIGVGTTMPAPGYYLYDLGSVVPLTAIAEEGWNFCGWTGDIHLIEDPASANTHISMSASASVNAVFSAVFPTSGVLPDPLQGILAGDVEFTFGFRSETTALHQLDLDVYLGDYAGDGNRDITKHLGYNFPASSPDLNYWIDEMDLTFSSNSRPALIVLFGGGDNERGEWYVRFGEAIGFEALQSRSALVKTRLHYNPLAVGEGLWTLTLNSTVLNESKVEFLVSVSDDLCGKWGENNWTLPGIQSFIYHLVPRFVQIDHLLLIPGQDTCFAAVDTLIAGGNVEALSGSSLQLIAGKAVILIEGFRAYTGSQVLIKIDEEGLYCFNPPALLADSSTLDIDDLESPSEKSASDYSFLIHPNPTMGVFTVTINDNTPGWILVQILSIHGQLVEQRLIDNSSQLVFDLSKLPSNIYLIRLSSEIGNEVKKIIKH